MASEWRNRRTIRTRGGPSVLPCPRARWIILMVDKKPLSSSQKPDSPILANEPTWVGAALPVQAERSSTAASDSQAEIPRLIAPPTDGAGRDFPLRDVFL